MVQSVVLKTVGQDLATEQQKQSAQALNAKASVLMRGRKGTDRKGGGKKKKKKRRRQCDHRGRDWNDVATHPGMQTTIRSGRGKEAFSLRASGEGLAHWHPDFGLLASRLSVALSHPVYSTLLQQLQETNTPESSVSSGPSFSHSRPWDPEQS